MTRGGVSYEWPGGYFQQFAEEYLPEYAWNIERFQRCLRTLTEIQHRTDQRRVPGGAG
ncbi:MAG: hypothetical protein ACPIOQ_18625 [Promethearchaeia archaeon]